ncbi:MAG: GNAT family N-acetyltransferase [Pseudomonadota bacterium]
MSEPITEKTHIVSVLSSLDDIDRGDWDTCAQPEAPGSNPFVSYDFLHALEKSKSAIAETGWYPQHLVLQDDAGDVSGVAPCYLKSHSQGEYVFDYGWADAFERAGGRYYPKLQIAVPFTPVTGPRLLTKPGDAADENRMVLASAAAERAKNLGASSIHVTFTSEAEANALAELGYLHRTDQQFHFENNGYASFDDFLAELASRKRKQLRKERAQALANDITIEWVSGSDITEAHLERFYLFYMDTGSRKWGTPYLTRRFFDEIAETMADKMVFIFAKRAGKIVAGALNIVGADTIFGRYWGCMEDHPFLHFEVCYYQAIDYAIEHKLQYVEAGAQGGHKLLRGYLPVTTHSAHFIVNPSFRKAVADYLVHERRQVAYENERLAERAPFKKCDVPQSGDEE